MPAKTKPTPNAEKERPLTPKQQAFIREYLIDLNATQAAKRAGYSAHTAEMIGKENLRKPPIKAAIDAAISKRSEKTEITAEKVLQRLWHIATADPNELIQHRRVNCRHCYGIGHEYQWIDEAEYDRACRAIEAETKHDEVPVYPSRSGGLGFDPKLTPHAKCPKCSGEGYGQVHALDTRKLSPAARALYAGVKATKDGLEIKMHDQFAALALVGKHLGIANDKIKLGVDEDDPLARLLAGFMGSKLLPVELPGRTRGEIETKDENTTQPDRSGDSDGSDVDRGGVERRSSSAITPRDPDREGENA